MRILNSLHRVAASCCLAVSLCYPAAPALAAPLCLADIIRPPVDISLTGDYYTDRKKTFSLDVAQDRFIKRYDDGVTIIGIKEGDAPIYQIVDDKKKTVLKISQGNLYRIGRFFNWSSMTTLLDLPDTTTVIPQHGKAGDCTGYSIANSDLELCVDGNRHILRTMTKKGEIIAQICSVKKLTGDLKDRSDAVILACQQQHYNFLDMDTELSPDAD
jgi:hypothetical protein